MVLIGTGFDSGTVARIGGLPLTGLNVAGAESITGRTPTALSAGVHDVEVANSDGEVAYLAGGFEITESGGKDDSGCGCATASAPTTPSGILAMMVGILGLVGWTTTRRRR